MMPLLPFPYGSVLYDCGNEKLNIVFNGHIIVNRMTSKFVILLFLIINKRIHTFIKTGG